MTIPNSQHRFDHLLRILIFHGIKRVYSNIICRARLTIRKNEWLGFGIERFNNCFCIIPFFKLSNFSSFSSFLDLELEKNLFRPINDKYWLKNHIIFRSLYFDNSILLYRNSYRILITLAGLESNFGFENFHFPHLRFFQTAYLKSKATMVLVIVMH